MRIINFFQNCLSRRSFQFLSFIGMLIILFFLLIILFIYDSGEYLVLVVLPITLPTFGLVSGLSVIAIYLKLLVRECRYLEYRLTNRFLTQNPIYGFFAFIFFIVAIVALITFSHFANVPFEIYEEVFKYPIYLYPFLFYCLINILIVFKI